MSFIDAIKKVLVSEFPTEVVDVDTNKIVVEISASNYGSLSETFFEIISQFQDGAGLKIISMTNTLISAEDKFELSVEFE